jgi:hypothetical protein
MGWLADRIGIRSSVVLDAIYPRMFIYVSRWFDRRRGNASNLVQAILCVAGLCCCIPMAVPSQRGRSMKDQK